MHSIIKILVISLTAMLLNSCYNNYGADSYAGNSVGQAQIVRMGVIAQVQKVAIQDESNQGIGSLAGIAVGAILGSRIGGGGTANALGGIAGGLAGGAAGHAAGKAIGQQQGLRYIVKLSNGGALSVVQGPEPAFTVGQRVIVLTGSNGRDRVIADNNPPANAQTKTSSMKRR